MTNVNCKWNKSSNSDYKNISAIREFSSFQLKSFFKLFAVIPNLLNKLL